MVFPYRETRDPSVRASRFLRACHREPTDATPVWLMRQAGRYMPEYRSLRATMSMLDAIRAPEVVHQITMQPINAFDLDAAILFSDILIPLVGMGLDLTFEQGEGPCLHNPLRTIADIKALSIPAAADAMPYTLLAIRALIETLTPRGIPLIGFAGGPFTLASYAIEGGGSRTYERTKSLMWHEPAAWHDLMTKLVAVVGDLLIAQVEAGVSAVQVFDSWAGILSPHDYAQFVAPHVAHLFEIVHAAPLLQERQTPTIYFGTDTASLLDQIALYPCDVVGVDWRINLDAARARLASHQAIQGNLDPVALFAPWPVLRDAIDEVLRQAAGLPGHIFNLGHGVLPGTPVDTVRKVVDYVHQASRR